MNQMITEGLEALIARGFHFTHPRDTDGSLISVVGIHAHHGVIDIVQLYGEDDADAARVPGDEPDVLFPRTVLWRVNGTAHEVIQQTLGLHQPTVERINPSKGCWVPTQPGRATWLAATA